MKNRKGVQYSILSFVLVIVLVFSLSACGDKGEGGGLGNVEIGSSGGDEAPAIVDEGPKVDADKVFAEIEDRLFRESVTEDSLSFHFYMKNPDSFGLTMGPTTWGDFWTPEYHEKDLADSRQLLEELNQFEKNDLTKEGDRILYEVLKAGAELSIATADYYYYSEPFHIMSGEYIDIPLVMAEFEFRKKDDIDLYLELLALYGEYIDRQIEYEKEKSKLGLFMPDFVLDQVIEQAEGILEGSLDGSHYLFDTFNLRVDELDFLDDEQKQEYKDTNEATLLERFFPVYDKIIAQLETLRGTGSEEISAEQKKHYQMTLAYRTASNFTPEFLIELLEAEIGRSQYGMIYALQYDEGVWDAYYDGTLTKGSLEENNDYLKSIYTKIFPKLPDHNLDLSKLPESMRFLNAAAYYMSQPVDDYKDNIIRVNPGTAERADDIMFVLAHEGYGGHLLQSVYGGANEIGNLRRLMSLTCYGEGFANYGATHLLYASDFDPALTIFAVSSRILDACVSARIEIGIYYEGWTENDVAKLIQNLWMIPDEDMEDQMEGMRDYYESMYATKNTMIRYGVGIAFFNKLRDEAEEKQGRTFNELTYNTRIMEIGPCFLNTLEELLDI